MSMLNCYHFVQLCECYEDQARIFSTLSLVAPELTVPAAAICLLSSWSCPFWNVIATSSQHTAFVLSFLHSACLWDSVVLPNVLMFGSL